MEKILKTFVVCKIYISSATDKIVISKIKSFVMDFYSAREMHDKIFFEYFLKVFKEKLVIQCCKHKRKYSFIQKIYYSN